MRWFSLPIVFAVAACASQEDAMAPDDQLAAGGTVADASHADAASGGGARADASPDGISGSGGRSNTGGGVGSGGSTSSGGAAGSGGDADVGHPPVGPCPSGTGQVGVWENVEPSAFHSPSNMQTIAVVVNPEDASVFAAASNKTNGGSGSTGIYKSADCGATWTAWNTGANQANLATGQLWAMLIDPAVPQNMYVANGYGNGPTIYKSTNGGVDWSALNPDASHVLTYNFVQAIAMDPGNSQHVAVTFHENCGAPFTSNCLSRSTDGGATWEEFNGPAAVNGWQEGATLSILGATNYLYACGQGVWYTSDAGQLWTKVIQQGVFGRYAGSTDLAPDGTLYLGVSNTGMFYSRANMTATPPVLLGSSWTLIPNSPQSTNIIDDGVTLVAAEVNGPPFFSASLGAPTVWTHMPSAGVTSGSNQMAYDAAHHIIYSANFQSGLLRLVTR